MTVHSHHICGAIIIHALVDVNEGGYIMELMEVSRTTELESRRDGAHLEQEARDVNAFRRGQH